MITKLKLDLKNGQVSNKESDFKPSDKVKEITKKVLDDFRMAEEIRNKPYTEFNNKSLLERINEDQKAWNSYQESGSDDPDLAWKSNAIRPITRNKIISIVAHVTGSIIYPQIFAQNEDDEEDRNASEVMRDLLEWSFDQSEYAKNFVYAVISACINPAVIIEDCYYETFRKIKEWQENGSWKTKEIIDELFSGFKNPIIPLDEFFIADIYEPEVQKQSFTIRRKVISYDNAQAKYESRDNFKYVTRGVQSLYNENTGLFYEVSDDSLESRNVEEVIYENRMLDLRLEFVNGIIMCDPDYPNPRQDKMYPYVKFGYEPINDRFFYYKSLAFKLAPDQDVINTLYQMIIDGNFLKLMPPSVVFGEETINSSIITPGKITVFSSPDTKFEKLDIGNELNAGYNTIAMVEKSITESSMDVLQQGQSASGNQTAYEISRMEENARIMLGLFGKMIGFAVKDLGVLRVSSILQYMTVAQVDELSGNELKYKKFLFPERIVDGKSKTKKIEFSSELPDEMTEEEEMKRSYDVLQEEGGVDSDKEIWKVNPSLFRRRKYILKIEPNAVLPRSDRAKKAFDLELFDRAIQLPFANHEALYKDLLLGSYDTTKNNVEKYYKEQAPMVDAMAGVSKGEGTRPIDELLKQEV